MININIDLELSIISCLLYKPELFNELIVKEEHFVKHQRIWKFIKAIYDKFGTLDVALMYSVCSTRSQYKLVLYVQELLEYEPAPSNFMKYQERLIEQFDESKKEQQIINQIYDLSNELFTRKITLGDFIKKIEEKKKEIEK